MNDLNTTPTSGIWLRLFGLPTCTVDGANVALPTRKIAALVAFLALEGPVSRTHVAELLWPDFVEDTARKNLRQALHMLSKTPLKTALEVSPGTLRFTGVTSDVARFRALEPHDPTAALRVQTAAFLDGFDARGMDGFETWMLEQRQRFAQARAAVLTRVAHDLEAAGDLRGALEHRLELLKNDALQEHQYRDAMRLHASLGEREAALRLYAACDTALGVELGLEPLEVTRALAESIRAGTLARSAVAPSAPRAGTLEVPFTGRQDALAALEDGWARHQVIVVTGEPGAGKSRLLREFLDGKGPVLTMHGRPEDRTVAYASFARFLRAWLRDEQITLEPWVHAQLARLLPELGSAEPADTSQLRLFEAVSEVMRQAMVGKVALFADDGQYVDDPSGELGRYALSRITTHNPRHRTVAAYRADQLSRAQLEPMLELERVDLATVVDLNGLSEGEVAGLVAGLSGRPARLLPQRLQRATGGNPFFLIETLRALFERGDLRVEDNVWVSAFDDTTRDYRELPIPDTVRAVVLARVDHCGSAVRRTLEVGAVAGEVHFTPQSVITATALAEFEVLAALETAMHARLIAPTPTGYRFEHDLIPRALIDALSPARERSVHRQLAVHLESIGAQAARIAAHLERAGEARAAALAWTRAARESHALYAFTAALGYFDRALKQWKTVAHSDPERLTVMLSRYWLARQIGAANDPTTGQTMLALAQTPLERGNALFVNAVAHRDTGEHRAGLDAARRAAEQLTRANDANAAMYALVVAGAHARALEDWQEAFRLVDRTLEIARGIGGMNLVEAHQERGITLAMTGDRHGALEAFQTSLRVYEDALASGERETSAHWLLGARVRDGLAENLWALGRFSEALEHAEAAVLQARARAVPKRELEFLVMRARVLIALGLTQRARADLECALPLSKQFKQHEQDVATLLGQLP